MSRSLHKDSTIPCVVKTRVSVLAVLNPLAISILCRRCVMSSYSSYRSQANVHVCSKRLVGFYICCRPPAFRGCSPTRQTFWLVFKRSTGHSRISRLCWWCVVQQSTGQPVPHTAQFNAKWNMSTYSLRRRPHNRELVNKTSRLVESSFIVRMLYKDIC